MLEVKSGADEAVVEPSLRGSTIAKSGEPQGTCPHFIDNIYRGFGYVPVFESFSSKNEI